MWAFRAHPCASNVLALHRCSLSFRTRNCHRTSHNNDNDMRWLLSFLLLGLLSVVHAVSSSGSKLLVVLEELADKTKYSKYLADLESAYISRSVPSVALYADCFSPKGRGFKTTIESPKAEKIALFELGERAYDHVLLLPAKSKGMARLAMGDKTATDSGRPGTKSHTQASSRFH